nr:undecaprenyl diphosphate synthase family protein [Streptomyces qinzhouensis]
MTVNLDVGYDGRSEIADVVRGLIQEDGTFREGTDRKELIGGPLRTAGQPDPDVIIRTSGERRPSGSCCGSRCGRSTTSAMCTGRPAPAPTSTPPWTRSPSADAGSAPEPAVASPQ